MIANSVYGVIAISTPFTVGSGGTAGTPLAFRIQPGGGLAGVPWSQQPQVAVLDANGNVAAADNSAIVTLAIGSNADGGTLSCVLGNSRNAVGGIATFAGCQIDVASVNPRTLVATSVPALAPAISAPFVVSAGRHLAFVVQPVAGPAGAAWAQQLRVAVQDAANNTVTTDNSTVVTLALGTNPTGGALTCTGGTSRGVIAGVATFTGCSITPASAGVYTLVATSPSIPGATSAAFAVSVVGAVAITFAVDTATGAIGTGFSTSTKVVKVGRQIMVRIQTNPPLANTNVGIWIARKRGTTWSAFAPHATIRLDGAGVGSYVYSAGSTAWLSFRVVFRGDPGHIAGTSPGRQIRWI